MQDVLLDLVKGLKRALTRSSKALESVNYWDLFDLNQTNETRKVNQVT